MTAKLNHHLHDTDSVEVSVCLLLNKLCDAVCPISSLFFKDRRSFGEMRLTDCMLLNGLKLGSCILMHSDQATKIAKLKMRKNCC